jgi:hypothetical protein
MMLSVMWFNGSGSFQNPMYAFLQMYSVGLVGANSADIFREISPLSEIKTIFFWYVYLFIGIIVTTNIMIAISEYSYVDVK